MFPPNHRRGVRKGLHEKTRFRIEQAIRLALTNLGITDTQIAAHLGLTSSSYSRLKNTTLYKQLRSQFETNILSAADAELYSNYAHLRKKLEIGVPIALENLVAAATQKLDRKLQLDASKELLDRHGMFSKVSRIGLPTAEQGGVATEKDNELALELLKAAAKAAKTEKKDDVVSAENSLPSIEDEPLTKSTQ